MRAVRRPAALIAAAALLAASGCGTTYVIPSEPRARVYVDGEMVGHGQGTIRQRGLPGSAQVLVMTEDGRRKQQSVSRSFTVVTFLLGFITYGVCWVACWEYPGSVAVALPAPAGGFAAQSGASGAGGVDPWLQPPPGWHPPAGDAPPPGGSE
jgi:hypothetical protein